MQELADGMFQQPIQEMALIWAIERRERMKAPALEEYLEMCRKDKTTIEREDKENGKELHL